MSADDNTEPATGRLIENQGLWRCAAVTLMAADFGDTDQGLCGSSSSTIPVTEKHTVIPLIRLLLRIDV